MQRYIQSLILLLLISVTVEAAESFWMDLRQEFDSIRIASPDETHMTRLNQLIAILERESKENPSVDFLALYGVVLAYQAKSIGGIQALAIASRAKSALEESIKKKNDVFMGYALATLGTLYESVPAWPLSFGDRKRGAQLLDDAYRCCKKNIDVSFLYATHAANVRKWDIALQVLKYATELDRLPVNSEIGFNSRVKAVIDMMGTIAVDKKNYEQAIKTSKFNATT